MKEANNTNSNSSNSDDNNRTVDKDVEVKKEVFKEAFRKFSTSNQLHQDQPIARLSKKGPKGGEAAGNPQPSKPEKIPLNQDGKEEFCITFEKVGTPELNLTSLELLVHGSWNCLNLKKVKSSNCIASRGSLVLN